MRARLLLSVAVATLSLSVPPSYAQTADRDRTGGETLKPEQGESGTHAKTPGHEAKQHGAREQRGEAQSRERRDAAEQARESNRPGAGESAEKAARQDERSKEERHGPGAKKSEKHGAKSEDHGRGQALQGEHGQAAQGERGRAAQGEHGQTLQGEQKRELGARKEHGAHPAAQGAREAEKQEQPGRAGATATEQERRGEAARAGRDERQGQAEQQGRNAPERSQGLEPGQEAGREMNRGGAGRDEAAQGVDRRRETYGYAGREQRGGVRLDERQQSRVREIIDQRGVRGIPRNEFNVQIGAVAPPSVQFYPLPPEVVSIVPQYRGYDFVRVEDEIAIIDPGSRRVVSMLGAEGPLPGGPGFEERQGGYGAYERREGGRYGSMQREEGRYGARGGRRGEAYGYAPRVRLDARQERALYGSVMREAHQNLRQVCVRVGERVPQSVDLEPVPRNIAADAPDIERYDYFILNDQVVLVDPDSRVVVDIIQEPR